MGELNSDVYNAVFFTAITTSLVGMIIALVKICSKSKCDEFRCCGIYIHRNIQAEIEEEKMELADKARPRPPSTETDNI
jgi:hypothetical protein